MEFVRPLMLSCLLLLAGCAAQPTFVSSPLPDRQAAPAVELIPGDLLEVNYFATGLNSPQAYLIAAGDRLRIDVAEHPELSRQQVLVVSDGSIGIPAAGQVGAGGRTVKELGIELERRYRSALIRNPRVVVSVEEGDTRLRSLVNRRGLSSAAESNLFEIAESGLLSLPAIPPLDARRPLDSLRSDVQAAYRVAFAGQVEATVNLRQSKPRRVHVIGEVVRAGSVDYPSRGSVMSAVASAGGFLNTAETGKVVLFRYNRDGTGSQWLVDMKTALSQADSDASHLLVRPEDVIYVPKSGIALANDAVDLYVRRMVPIPITIGVGIAVQPW